MFHVQIGEPAGKRNSRTKHSGHGVDHAINEAHRAEDEMMPDGCAAHNAEGHGM